MENMQTISAIRSFKTSLWVSCCEFFPITILIEIVAM